MTLRIFKTLLPLALLFAALFPAAARADKLADYRAAVSADTPIAYWHLDETSGTAAADFGSAGATGTYAGSPALGSAAPFGAPANTAVGFGTLATMTAQVPGTMNSVEFWVRPSKRVGQTFLTFGDPATSTGWAVGMGGAKAQGSQKRRIFFTADGKTTNSKVSLPAGSWSMVYVAWGPGNKLRFSINGGAISKTPAAHGLPHSSSGTSALVIGPGAGTGGTLIDEVALYPGRPGSAGHYAPSALPVAQSEPSISPLTGVQVGQTLTLTRGAWNAGTTVTDVWQRCDSIGACQAIAGASGTSYTLTAGDAGFTIQVAETGSNAAGSIVEYTDSTDAVAQPSGEQPTSPPVLPPGTDPTVPDDESQDAIDEGGAVIDPNTDSGAGGSGSGGSGSGGSGSGSSGGSGSGGSGSGGSGSGGSDSGGSGGSGSGGSGSGGSGSGGSGSGGSGSGGSDSGGSGSGDGSAGGDTDSTATAASTTTGARNTTVPGSESPTRACVSAKLVAVRAVRTRIGRKRAKLMMSLNLRRRTVSVRAGRRVIRRVGWTVDGKLQKGKRQTSLKLSALSAGGHVVKARLTPRKGRAKTVTLKFRADCG